MNLGQAVAVCLYELVRDGRALPTLPPGKREQEDARAADAERITAILLEAMVTSGYLKRKPTSDAEERLRRLVRRLKLQAGDVPAWLGILRQIEWKLHN